MVLFGFGLIIMLIHFEYQVGSSMETIPNHAKPIHDTLREEYFEGKVCMYDRAVYEMFR